MTDTAAEPGLPDLDSIPTVPPPPPPVLEPPPRRRPRATRTTTGSPVRLLVLILAVEAAITSSTVLVAVGRPSVPVAMVAAVLTNVFVVAAVLMMVGMVGRTR